MKFASLLVWLCAFTGVRLAAAQTPDPLALLIQDPSGPGAELRVLQMLDDYHRNGAGPVLARMTEAARIPSLSEAATRRIAIARARIALWTGDIPAARRFADDQGYITDWLFAGPFRNENGTATPIPRDLLDAAPAAGDRCLPFPDRTICLIEGGPHTARFGEVHTSAVFSPHTDICTLAQTVVSVEKDGPLTLHFGAGGDAVVYWNDKLLLRDEHHGQADPARYRMTFRATRGDNLLTVRQCSDDSGTMSFFARIDNGDGPLRVFRRPPRVRLLEPGPSRIPSATGTLTELERRATAKGAGAEAMADFVDFALRTGAVDKERSTFADLAARACRKSANPVHCLLPVRLEAGVNDQRSLLETSLQQKGQTTELLAALTSLEMQSPGWNSHRASLDRLVALAPHDPDIQCLQLNDLQKREQYPLLHDAVRRWIADASTPPSLLRCAARALLDMPLRASTLPAIRAALRWYADDMALQTAAARLESSFSGRRALRTRLAIIDALAIPDMDVDIELSALQEGNGDSDGARRRLEGRCAMSPGDAACWKALGLLYLRTTPERNDAFSLLKDAAALQPQDRQLQNYLHSLDPGGPFEEPFVIEPADFLPLRQPAQVEDARYLVNTTVIRVLDSGQTSRFSQIVLEIGTREAAKNWQQFSVPFSPDLEQVTVLEARVFRADGRVDNAISRGEVETSQPWSRLYFDTRAEVVELPFVHRGDVIEYRFRVDDIGSTSLMGSYFGDVSWLTDGYPALRWDYAVIAPITFDLRADPPHLPTLVSSVTDTEDSRLHLFRATDIPRVPLEPAIVGDTTGIPYLHISSMAGWAAVREWYAGLVLPQLTADDAIRRTAARLTAGARTDEAKVAAIYDWLITNLRYVGLEFGIHGYRPYPAAQVMSRGFGDCKDSATLLVSLLKAAGIEAEVALVRTRHAGDLRSEVASLSAFDHAITHVPGLDLWLDGTAKYHGIRELPFADQGVMALPIRPDAVDVVRTPFSDAAASTLQATNEYRISADGSAFLRAETSASGPGFAPEIRATFASGSDRRQIIEAQLSSQYPGARVEEASFSDLADTRRSPAWRYRAQIPAFGTLAGNAMTLPVGQPLDLTTRWATLAHRTLPLEIGPASRRIVTTVIEIPAGWTVDSLPPASSLSTPFGSLDLQVRMDGKRVHVRREFTIRQPVILPDDYKQFAGFCREVDAALAGRLTLRKP